ncbi:OsmC family protein [Agromyces allii]|uniref:OsmC family protein n=1 Tax=Agromyces allii TaxID=393607 RepID=A0ABP5BG19_9MICO|nr:OsmC family protein [Agromyces allii]
MTREHHYDLTLRWTGDLGRGTAGYRAYSRDHLVGHATAGELAGSSDPAFRGDPTRWNPEQLLVASIAQCHMLWYLHLATEAGIVVTGYEDAPGGTMLEEASGAGRFAEVVLRPVVTIAAGDPAVAEALHERVGEFCFIARSVNVPIRHEPTIVPAPSAAAEPSAAPEPSALEPKVPADA